MKIALIVGATGIVGKELVAQLCEDERYQPMHGKDIARVIIGQAQRPEKGQCIYSPQQIQK